MCGIIGYTGSGEAAEILLRGLRRVDSIAPLLDGVEGGTGIAHTRWATHGKVTDENAHPHTSCGNDLAIVHNGIVENHAELRAELEARGHVFRSETDSEVIAHLLEEALRGSNDPLRAALEVCGRLRGSYARHMPRATSTDSWSGPTTRTSWRMEASR